jgi:DNA-binding PadR family transcriptional regulator
MSKPAGNKPLQEPTFLVLTALIDQPLHGYALLQEVDRISGGRTQMRVGTLYAVLDRLAGEGLVEIAVEEIVNNRLRRTYRITETGTAALSAETDRMESLARTARTRMARLVPLTPRPSTRPDGA